MTEEEKQMEMLVHLRRAYVQVDILMQAILGEKNLPRSPQRYLDGLIKSVCAIQALAMDDEEWQERLVQALGQHALGDIEIQKLEKGFRTGEGVFVQFSGLIEDLKKGIALAPVPMELVGGKRGK